MSLKILIKESIDNKTFWHGTRSMFPFKEFDPSMDGSGIVSGMTNKDYGGFFFTDEKETAKYFSEWLICKVKIKDIQVYGKGNDPNKVMKEAIKDNQSYMIKSITDGTMVSNVVVVPHDLVQNDVEIIDWEFIGIDTYYKETLTERFGIPEADMDDSDTDEGYFINKDHLNSFFRTVGLDKDYILNQLPEFKEYYNNL